MKFGARISAIANWFICIEVNSSVLIDVKWVITCTKVIQTVFLVKELVIYFNIPTVPTTKI